MCSNCSGNYENPELTALETMEHGYDGSRHHESANYEGGVFACLCGDRFMNWSDLVEHIIPEGLGREELHNYLDRCYANYTRLNLSSYIQGPSFVPRRNL